MTLGDFTAGNGQVRRRSTDDVPRALRWRPGGFFLLVSGWCPGRGRNGPPSHPRGRRRTRSAPRRAPRPRGACCRGPPPPRRGWLLPHIRRCAGCGGPSARVRETGQSSGLLRLSGKLSEVTSRVIWLEGAIDGSVERLAIDRHLLGAGHLLDADVGF